jgi:hypothetical protein
VTESDLVEIAKRNGEFRKHYGRILGAVLLAWTSHLATRPRPIFGPAWVVALATIVAAVWKLWRS